MNITIFIWRVRTRSIPFAIARMALDRFALRKVAGLTFFKLLGTGKGETFTPRDADLRQWGLLVVGSEGAITEVKSLPLVRRWAARATESAHFDLQTLSSHGQWAGREPFTTGDESSVRSKPAGAVAAITRARIKASKNFRFWRAVPPVIEALDNAPGLIAAIGIGEAPIGLQGTFSLWSDAQSLRNFAYKSDAHQKAITATKEIGWYSEELFARFSVASASGRVNGIAVGNTAD
ncbi:MAG: spheroidene monooxygenase [Actinobacteria bacterium]|nr:spheroidene monooxygenase [Actinomycetota bacterium]